MSSQLNRTWHLWAYIAATACSLLLYSGSVGLPFFSDDFEVLLRLSKGNFDTGIFLRPLGDLTLYLQHQFAGFKPVSYHLVNVLLHGAATYLVFRTGFLLATYLNIAGKRQQVAIVGAILFMFYPLHAEAVIWVVGRGIILSAIFFFISLGIYLGGSGKLFSKLLSLLAFIVAIAGYETALVLPFIIMALSLLRSKSLRGSILDSYPYWMILAVYFIIRYVILGEMTGGGYFMRPGGAATLVYNFCAALSRSFIAPFIETRHFIIAAFIGFVVLLGATIRLARSREVVRNAIILFVLLGIALLPVAAVGISTHDQEGGRFIYQSAFFATYFLAMLIVYSFRRRVWANGLTVILLAVCGLVLMKVIDGWKQAAAMVRSSMNSIPHLTRPSYFFNVPGKINSAYVFRNGFKEACVIYGKSDDAANIHVISLIDPFIAGSDSTFKPAQLPRGWSYDQASAKLSGNGIFYTVPAGSIFIWHSGRFTSLPTQ